MSSWRQEYLAMLEDRDRREKANSELFNAYTKLATKTSALEANPEPPTSQANDSSERPSTAGSGNGTGSGAIPADSKALSGIRADLKEAQTSRAILEAQLEAATSELEGLRQKSKGNEKRIYQVSLEKTTLQQRVKDRDEELRGKAKLLENVQDEMLSLNIQLNVAEQQSNKLKRDNKELVDRWMALKAKEADAMNKGSKFS
ncbi:MAG: hypothetical protein M1824_003843 [Vezdaea acicularis]|nr:MAG: hypothetical protein M1824_003843 [Vezdaea acicularis]